MDGIVALRPGVTDNTEGFLNISSGKEIINNGKVVAEGTIAGELIVVNVELGGISGDLFNSKLALGHSDSPGGVLNERLAESESLDETIVGSFVNDLVFVGEGSVLGILPVSRDETVTNGRTLEVDIGIFLLDDVGGDGRNVVTGIRFTSNVELSALVLGESSQEFGEEGVEVLSNFVFRGFELSGVGVASTEGLVNVEDVGNVVPGVGIDGQ